MVWSLLVVSVAFWVQVLLILIGIYAFLVRIKYILMYKFHSPTRFNGFDTTGIYQFTYTMLLHNEISSTKFHLGLQH